MAGESRSRLTSDSLQVDAIAGESPVDEDVTQERAEMAPEAGTKVLTVRYDS